ncbi:uncharacterized protein scml4 isoform X4 [Xiphias gladius]|uniref:uncharacterized protein scml4 isoform X4 n=1 Tax=Xiphias gladius TaxID=8245 RepID=UPI001A99C38A|nr:uncharacterized protein scml4 isoform X4 [Xiphias gladius]
MKKYEAQQMLGRNAESIRPSFVVLSALSSNAHTTPVKRGLNLFSLSAPVLFTVPPLPLLPPHQCRYMRRNLKEPDRNIIHTVSAPTPYHRFSHAWPAQLSPLRTFPTPAENPRAALRRARLRLRFPPALLPTQPRAAPARPLPCSIRTGGGWNPVLIQAESPPRCFRSHEPAAEEWIPAVESTPPRQCDVSHPTLAGCKGMRLQRGQDFSAVSHLDLAPLPLPVAWLPGVLSKGVRLRLRLDRRDNRGRGCWHLVDLDAESEPAGRRLRSHDPDTCAQSLMSTLSVGSEMQTPALGQQFIAGPQGKVPGRKRGRPPIRKLEFQTHYVEPLSPLKVPKKRGRKPGFKLKPRMVMSPLANSPPSSTPEPEMGSIPQDAAIVPHSATPQVLTG